MHYDPKCRRQKHNCLDVCISENCNVQNPFVCGKCIPEHKKCDLMPYKKLVHEFHKRQGLFSQQILRYEERVENTFQEMIKALREEFVKFREQFEYYNITDDIEYIYQKIRNKSENDLRGYDMWRALEANIYKGNKLEIKKELQMRLQKKKMFDIFNHLLKELPPYYSLKEQITIENKELSEINEFQQMKIKYADQERRKISGLLKDYFPLFQKQMDKKAYNLKLLYKATEHNFSARQFHKRCDGIPNTVTIAKTEFNKIVIGYCTFPWSSPKTWTYKEDTKRKCFLYSPSEGLDNRKFISNKIKFAIGMHEDYGPSFGDDFVIYDKAHHSRNCWSNFPDVYKCEESPVPHSAKTINRFVGVNDHYEKFNLLEWEVYYISYGPEDELEQSFMREYKEIPMKR